MNVPDEVVPILIGSVLSLQVWIINRINKLDKAVAVLSAKMHLPYYERGVREEE